MNLREVARVLKDLTEEEKENVFVRRKKWDHDHYCFYVCGTILKVSDMRSKKAFANMSITDEIRVAPSLDERNGNIVTCNRKFTLQDFASDDWEIVKARDWITDEDSPWFI